MRYTLKAAVLPLSGMEHLSLIPDADVIKPVPVKECHQVEVFRNSNRVEYMSGKALVVPLPHRALREIRKLRKFRSEGTVHVADKPPAVKLRKLPASGNVPAKQPVINLQHT